MRVDPFVQKPVLNIGTAMSLPELQTDHTIDSIFVGDPIFANHK